MGISTHVVGFRRADKKWNNMKKIWDACEAAGVETPRDVLKFFDGEDPGDRPGMEIEIGKAITPFKNDREDGFEIEIDELPKDVKVLRFYNSW